MDISPLRYRAKYECSHLIPERANDQRGTGTCEKSAGRTLPDGGRCQGSRDKLSFDLMGWANEDGAGKGADWSLISPSKVSEILCNPQRPPRSHFRRLSSPIEGPGAENCRGELGARALGTGPLLCPVNGVISGDQGDQGDQGDLD